MSENMDAEKAKEEINAKKEYGMDQNEKNDWIRTQNGKEKTFVNVEVNVVGRDHQKKIVEPLKVDFNERSGRLNIHWNETHVTSLSPHFLEKYCKLSLVQSNGEKIPAVSFKTGSGTTDLSTTRMKELAQTKDGQKTLVVPGGIGYHKKSQGLKMDIDSTHRAVITGFDLQKELQLGVKLTELPKRDREIS